MAIDSLDWLERLIWDAVCRRESATTIEKVGGGYGKGYTLALDYWRRLIDKLGNLHRDRGMMVFLIAHAKVEKFEDPEAPAYDRYSPRLHKHASAIITEWCDAVLFATKRFTTRTEESGFGRQRAIAAPVGAAGGERILKTVGGPSCVAKNRYRLKPEIPLAWDAIVGGILTHPTNCPTPFLHQKELRTMANLNNFNANQVEPSSNWKRSGRQVPAVITESNSSRRSPDRAATCS